MITSTALPQINLYDPALRVEQDAWTGRNVGLALLVCVLMMAGLIGWAQVRAYQASSESAQTAAQLAAASAEAKQLSDKLGSLKPDPRIERELEALNARLAARYQVLGVLQKGLAPESISQADILRGFARQTPNGLWLTGFRINADSGALEITGRT